MPSDNACLIQLDLDEVLALSAVVGHALRDRDEPLLHRILEKLTEIVRVEMRREAALGSRGRGTYT